MNTRSPLRSVRAAIPEGLFAFACGLLFFVSTAAATPFEKQLSRVEDKLSVIKMDVLRLYQSRAAGSDRPPLPSSLRAPESPVSSRNDQKSGVSIPEEADLREIAAMVNRLEQGAAPSRGTAPLPTDEMRLLLAQYFIQADLIPQAEQTLKKLAIQTRREPIAAEAWFRLEEIYYRKGDYQQALGSFYKIPVKGGLPLRQEATYLAGNSYLYLKEHLKAVELLNKIGEGSDFYPFALYSSGLSYLNLGDAWSSTQQQFQKLIAFDPGENPILQELINKTRVTLGFVFIDQKRYPEALAVLEPVPTQSRYRPQARFGIGQAHIGSEDCVKAIVVLKDLIQQYPTRSYALEARLHVANCYAKLSAYRRAVDSYQDALKAYSDRLEDLKKLSQKIQTTHLESWLFRPGSQPSEGGPRLVSLEQDLEIERGYPELMKVYADWFRLNDQIAKLTRQGLDKTIQKSDAEATQDSGSLPIRMQGVRRDLIELLRSAVTDQLLSQMEQMDEWVLRANIGIAKNLARTQSHETVP
ncbi:MAG: tetratricopeptide repeat protein [Nitrospirae bacterium]|nr:tetratricopeptide repeat protein [Nitrospirota bacterium]